MGNPILHKDGVYNIYSTICDAPLFRQGLTLEQLQEYFGDEYGAQGVRGLGDRLERAHRKGCSLFGDETLESCLIINRAGPNETELSVDEFVAQFLTLPGGDDDE